MRRHHDERGQGLVEFAMVVPMVLLLLVSVVELGIAFGNLHTLGYASREGARVGSALADGGAADCSLPDPAGVDRAIIGAVQRILKSPGSGIDMTQVGDVRVFKADAHGQPIEPYVNTWRYSPGATEIAPGTYVDFYPVSTHWNACVRQNSGPDSTDSVGVTVTYTYVFGTPLPRMLEAVAGGALSIALTETTVMALNPST